MFQSHIDRLPNEVLQRMLRCLEPEYTIDTLSIHDERAAEYQRHLGAFAAVCHRWHDAARLPRFAVLSFNTNRQTPAQTARAIAWLEQGGGIDHIRSITIAGCVHLQAAMLWSTVARGSPRTLIVSAIPGI